jgi:hypothetical protein
MATEKPQPGKKIYETNKRKERKTPSKLETYINICKGNLPFLHQVLRFSDSFACCISLFFVIITKYLKLGTNDEIHLAHSSKD